MASTTCGRGGTTGKRSSATTMIGGCYLALLAVTVAQARWRLLGFCLMGNHVHLLVETPEANLGSGMQRLHGAYARKFNDRHGRVGHVFQGRFENKLHAQRRAAVDDGAVHRAEPGRGRIV